jgi:hypothetical protein
MIRTGWTMRSDRPHRESGLADEPDFSFPSTVAKLTTCGRAAMQRIVITLVIALLILSLPVAADIRSDLRRVHRECEDGHKDLERSLEDGRKDLARSLKDISKRLERLERLLTDRR